MQEYTGLKENPLKTASLVLQDTFAAQFKELNRIQLGSTIDSFLGHGRSIPLILRLWLNVLRMPFVPLEFSKMMILRMLQKRSSQLLQSLERKDRRKELDRGRKLMRKLKIM